MAESSLMIDIKAGDKLLIADGKIVIELVKKSGRAARLRIRADRDVPIKVQNDNPFVKDVASMA